MPRSGGLFGEGSLGRRVVEATAQRTLGVDLVEQESLRGQLVEAVADLRLADRLSRRLGWLALNAVSRWSQGQDAEPRERLSVARRVREVAKQDSQMLYAVRLRIAFCFGRGVDKPRAPDPDVQDVLDDLWDAGPNKAELTTPMAQWRTGKDLFETMNVYLVVFGTSNAESLDGRVLLGSLQHDQVVGVQRDPGNWRRVIYYVVEEFVYEWDYGKHAPKPNPTRRTVYYEALEGMMELEEELAAGRTTNLPKAPPEGSQRPGRILHVAMNRGKEQAFGHPEMRTNIRWASAFNDLLAGQVGKAKAAQQYLMKVTAEGANTEAQLTDVAMRAVARRSPLANAELDDPTEPERPRLARPGSQWWENGGLKAEPLNLESGAASAKQDMESASQAFASGTNFPGHYFFGDPGSLAGSMAVELPVLKLTEVDQEAMRGVFATLCDLRIARALAVGALTSTREPTEDELRQGVELDADGMVERDLSYELKMPDTLRRNLPELMQLVADIATTFDPAGQSEPLNRALVGYALELLDMSDVPALVERMYAEHEQDLGGGEPTEGGDPTATGPDGRQHSSGNPYGAKIKSSPVVEAALGELWRRITGALERELDHDQGFRQLVESASSNGGSG